MDNFEKIIEDYHSLCNWYNNHKPAEKPKVVTKKKTESKLKLERVVETQEVL